MEDIEFLYKKRIRNEINIAVTDQEAYFKEEIVEVNKRIQNHPQNISKKRELELYLEVINENEENTKDELRPVDCGYCDYYELDNIRKIRIVAYNITKGKKVKHGWLKSVCKKGHPGITRGGPCLCPDYSCKDHSHDLYQSERQREIKILTQLKQQKQAELEQYQETQKQISLERRVK